MCQNHLPPNSIGLFRLDSGVEVLPAVVAISEEGHTTLGDNNIIRRVESTAVVVVEHHLSLQGDRVHTNQAARSGEISLVGPIDAAVVVIGAIGNSQGRAGIDLFRLDGRRV